MRVGADDAVLDAVPDAGDGARRRMRTLMETLYPICRSITGDGVRRTLDLVEGALPPGVRLERAAVPSGTEVFDWTIGEEWNVRAAWIADRSGAHVVDLADHTLNLVS